ncbi:MAG: hypothetical protein E6J71_27880 [Deltaproteobacteria bacterium]|nr:MAG: hypothetical protein E6J71_27880 [Deltaproteobacteria bacterium]
MPLDGRDVPPPPRHVGGDRGMTGPPVLWHFPISHYNEKARWALDWKGIPHVRCALALSYMPRALWATGQAKLPVLFLDGQAIADSTRIIEALERLQPEPALYPRDEAARRRALALEDFFDEEVGHAVRTAIVGPLFAHDPVSAGTVLTTGMGAVTCGLAAPERVRGLEVGTGGEESQSRITSNRAFVGAMPLNAAANLQAPSGRVRRPIEQQRLRVRRNRDANTVWKNGRARRALDPRLSRNGRHTAIHRRQRSLRLAKPLFDRRIVRGPCDDQAISRNAAVERAVRDAIHVLDVFGESHAEAIEVEVRVSRDEWIVRPIDHRRAGWVRRWRVAGFE